MGVAYCRCGTEDTFVRYSEGTKTLEILVGEILLNLFLKGKIGRGWNKFSFRSVMSYFEQGSTISGVLKTRIISWLN
jgi:hypothetical protein